MVHLHIIMWVVKKLCNIKEEGEGLLNQGMKGIVIQGKGVHNLAKLCYIIYR